MSEGRVVDVALPDAQTAQMVRQCLASDLTDHVRLWWPRDPSAVPPRPMDILLLGEGDARDLVRDLRHSRVRLIQGRQLGYEGIVGQLPRGSAFANAAGIHESATAEFAVSLLLAIQRDLPRFFAQKDAGEWTPTATATLAGSRVSILGFGRVGRAVAERLRPFGVDLKALARSARVENGVTVHALSDLDGVLRETDLLVVTLPGGDDTRHLLGDRELAALPTGAGVINVGRGSVLDLDALQRHTRSGGLRAALDVTEPEPLPSDHPLWRDPRVIITPHVAGLTTNVDRQLAALVSEQAARMVGGLPPLNVVVGP
jgi:phosphoglycerate dehydrogenase-like enzyme